MSGIPVRRHFGFVESMDAMIKNKRIVGYAQLRAYVEKYYPPTVRRCLDGIRDGDRFVDANHPEQGVNVIVSSSAAKPWVSAIDQNFKRWRYLITEELIGNINAYVGSRFAVYVDGKMSGRLWE